MTDVRRLSRWIMSLAAVSVIAVSTTLSFPVSAAVKVQEVSGSRGVTAWLVEDHSNPIITVSLAFRGGSALDPGGKEGIANLVSATLDEGAGDMDSEAFQNRLKDLAITLSFDAGLDVFSGTLRTLTRNKAEAFRLLRLALTEPRFDDDAVERIRSQILANLRRKSSDPRQIAAETMMKTLFPGHPYSRPADGTLESVPLIKLADLKAFAAERLARDNLVVGVVGDITAEDLASVLDTVFGQLPAEADLRHIADVTAASAPAPIVVELPIPQSVIRFGQNGIRRDDPDFYAAYIMNYVLGGGSFESRLYEEVREKRGLVYSAYTYLSPLDHAALIMGGAGTANERAAETVKVIGDEWIKMATSGVTAEELQDAKVYLTGSYALRFGSSQAIARMLTGLQLENLGIDYFERRNGFIEAVTLEDVNRVAKRLLKPENLTWVIVGQPVGLSTN